MREHIGLRLLQQKIRAAADPRTRASAAAAYEQQAADLLRAYLRACYPSCPECGDYREDTQGISDEDDDDDAAASPVFDDEIPGQHVPWCPCPPCERGRSESRRG
jgi:hypothetical protein